MDKHTKLYLLPLVILAGLGSATADQLQAPKGVQPDLAWGTAVSNQNQNQPSGQNTNIQQTSSQQTKLPNMNVYISKNEIRKLLGIDKPINYVTNGNINTYPLEFTIPLGYNQSDIIFTWQNLGQTSVNYSISLVIGNIEAVDRPTINVSRSGQIPRHEQVFKISLPCSGRVTDEVDVQVLINVSGFLEETSGNATAPDAQPRPVHHTLVIKRKKICTIHPVQVHPGPSRAPLLQRVQGSAGVAALPTPTLAHQSYGQSQQHHQPQANQQQPQTHEANTTTSSSSTTSANYNKEAPGEQAPDPLELSTRRLEMLNLIPSSRPAKVEWPARGADNPLREAARPAASPVRPAEPASMQDLYLLLLVVVLMLAAVALVALQLAAGPAAKQANPLDRLQGLLATGGLIVGANPSALARDSPAAEFKPTLVSDGQRTLRASASHLEASKLGQFKPACLYNQQQHQQQQHLYQPATADLLGTGYTGCQNQYSVYHQPAQGHTTRLIWNANTNTSADGFTIDGAYMPLSRSDSGSVYQTIY